jgi:hypothetical protein
MTEPIAPANDPAEMVCISITAGNTKHVERA